MTLRFFVLKQNKKIHSNLYIKIVYPEFMYIMYVCIMYAA